MDDAKLDILKETAFFKGLSEQVFLALCRKCHAKTYKAGELIVGHQDKSFDVLFLLAGQARVNIYSSAGRRVSFRDITRGAIFGELSAIDGQPRSASVEAVGPCSAAIMPRNIFLESLCEQPAFMTAILTHLTQQIRKITERVFEFSTLAVRNRVHAELLRIANPHAQNNEAVLSPAPTHEEIASRISTHREAVTRELSRLEDCGLITRKGRSLCINDLTELRRLVEAV